MEMQVSATSPGWRYDVGTYFRTDAPLALGGAVTAANVGMNGRCVQSTLAPAVGDADGDACGDLNGTSTCVVRQPLNLTCTDLGTGSGDVAVPVCVTWSTTPAGTCASSGLLPSPASKCACYVHTISGMPVAGGSPRGVLYAPANSIFAEDQSAGGPAPPAPPSSGVAPPPPWVRALRVHGRLCAYLRTPCVLTLSACAPRAAAAQCGGQPPFNWGTSSNSAASCPGDVWNKWGGSPLKPVQCVSQDLDVVRARPSRALV
jgi:hypothetical protein